MSDYDDECIHMNTPALCSICNGREAAEKRPVRKAAAAAKAAGTTTKRAASPAPIKRLTTRTVSTQSTDTEESVEKYRGKYPGDREATFEAYVDVFFSSEARDFPGGFFAFSRCANAEAERKETAPALVHRAEQYMTDAGYEASSVGGSRRWARGS